MIEKRASAIEEANVTRRHAISECTSSLTACFGPTIKRVRCPSKTIFIRKG